MSEIVKKHDTGKRGLPGKTYFLERSRYGSYKITEATSIYKNKTGLVEEPDEWKENGEQKTQTEYYEEYKQNALDAWEDLMSEVSK
jgi:hypothetical protein